MQDSLVLYLNGCSFGSIHDLAAVRFLSLLPVKERQGNRGASCIFQVNLIKSQSQSFSLKVTISIIVSPFMVRLKDCLYLLSLFLVESFSSVCDCLVPGIALPCVPSLLPHLHQCRVGQYFFHLNHCCFSYSEIPFLLPSWESNKSQKLCLNSVAPKWGKKLCLPGNREQSDRGVWVSVCWSSDSCKRMPLL